MLELLKRLVRAPAVILAALLLMVGLITPANAYISSGARISLAANTSDPLRIDNWMVWTKQADGTGVNVERALIGVASGCSSYFRSSPKWWVTGVHIYDGNSGTYIQSAYNGNMSTCDQTVWANKYGWDEGFVKVVVDAGANLSGEPDKWFTYTWHLYPSGNSVLVSADWIFY